VLRPGQSQEMRKKQRRKERPPQKYLRPALGARKEHWKIKRKTGKEKGPRDGIHRERHAPLGGGTKKEPPAEGNFGASYPGVSDATEK